MPVISLPRLPNLFPIACVPAYLWNAVSIQEQWISLKLSVTLTLAVALGPSTWTGLPAVEERKHCCPVNVVLPLGSILAIIPMMLECDVQVSKWRWNLPAIVWIFNYVGLSLSAIRNSQNVLGLFTFISVPEFQPARIPSPLIALMDFYASMYWRFQSLLMWHVLYSCYRFWWVCPWWWQQLH